MPVSVTFTTEAEVLGGPTYIPEVQKSEDGTTTTTFDDGSTLTTTADGTTTATEATDSAASGPGALDTIGGAIKGAATGAVGAVSGALKNLVGGGVSGLLGSTLGNLLGSTIRQPVPTGIIPNPMHNYASWSYALSLWWLDIQDYNSLSQISDIGAGTNFPLGPSSYVIAEDSGLYPYRRLPTQLGLNYNIQDIDFETVVGLNSKTKSSNMVTGTMTIVEPYGVTFLDSLIQASNLLGGGEDNYTSRPYMLQIDFVGYDDAGNPVPSSQTNIYRKRFPIHIIEMGIEVTSKGAEYKLSFVPMNEQAKQKEYATVPKNITVNAKTVREFFDANTKGSFTQQLNEHWRAEAISKKVQFADSLEFNIDPAIANCKIVYPKQTGITQANPNSKGIDLSKGNFSIPSGTQIQEIINKIILSSDYMIGQLGLGKQEDNPSNVQASQTQILNSYKVTVSTTYAGSDSGGGQVVSAFDNIRNNYAKRFTYNVHQYSVYDPKHPAAPQLTDSRPYTVKSYNYIYTGKNIDVLDLKINFNTTYYTAVNSYTTEKASTNTTPSTAIDSILDYGASLLLSPQLLGSLGVLPGFKQLPNLTPLRFKNIVGDQRDNTGFNIINDPNKQTATNVQRSLYTDQNQEMINVDLQIVGDPTLLKQDDWLYNPNPAGSSIFNGLLSQFDLAQQYGQIKMDNGELIVSLRINTPNDLDSDITNQGLMTPPIGSTPSIFSGQYKVITIKNNFSAGKFTQTLNLVRLTNSDIIDSSAPANLGRGAVGMLQNNMNSLNGTVQGAVSGLVGSAVSKVGTSLLGLASSALGSQSTPTSDSGTSQNTSGQATFDSSGAVNSQYDATRYGEG
jgi:hypothetical protein